MTVEDVKREIERLLNISKDFPYDSEIGTGVKNGYDSALNGILEFITQSHHPEPEVKSRDPRKFVTVCDNCLRASCWHGEFMCQNSKNAGTVDLPVSTLRALNLECSDYFTTQKGHIENKESESTRQEDMSKESTREPEKGFEEELEEIIIKRYKGDKQVTFADLLKILEEFHKRGYIRKEGK